MNRTSMFRGTSVIYCIPRAEIFPGALVRRSCVHYCRPVDHSSLTCAVISQILVVSVSVHRMMTCQ